MTDRRSKKELREDLEDVQAKLTKTTGLYLEQAVEIDSLAKDFAQTVRERDAAQRELDRIEGQKRLKDAAIAHAKEQEIIDGIQAGLIPVEVLQKALQAKTERATSLRFDLGNPIEKATYEAIARGPKPADSRYTVKSGTISFFPSSLKPTLDDFARGGTVVADAASVTFNIGGHGEKFTSGKPDFSKGGYVVSKPGPEPFKLGDEVLVQKVEGNILNAPEVGGYKPETKPWATVKDGLVYPLDGVDLDVRIARRGNHPAGSHYFGGVRDAA